MQAIVRTSLGKKFARIFLLMVCLSQVVVLLQDQEFDLEQLYYDTFQSETDSSETLISLPLDNYSSPEMLALRSKHTTMVTSIPFWFSLNDVTINYLTQ